MGRVISYPIKGCWIRFLYLNPEKNMGRIPPPSEKNGGGSFPPPFFDFRKYGGGEFPPHPKKMGGNSTPNRNDQKKFSLASLAGVEYMDYLRKFSYVTFNWVFASEAKRAKFFFIFSMFFSKIWLFYQKNLGTSPSIEYSRAKSFWDFVSFLKFDDFMRKIW